MLARRRQNEMTPGRGPGPRSPSPAAGDAATIYASRFSSRLLSPFLLLFCSGGKAIDGNVYQNILRIITGRSLRRAMPALRQSSFLIVPVPLLTEIVALVGDDRFRKNVSFAS